MAKPKSPARIEVEGLREVQSALRRLGDKETPKAIRKVNKDAAELVVSYALREVPVGATRKLRGSVKAQAGQRDARVKAGSPSRVPYARVIHWGTGPRPGLPGPHNIEGRPFMFNAVEKARPRVLKEYQDALDKLLDDWR